jgi:hypothetical protein
MNTRSNKLSLDEIPEIDFSKAKVIARGVKKDKRVTLRTLRVALGKTQADVSRTAEMDQGDVSRLEGRDDMRLSTLKRYVGAIGGKMEIAVVIGERRYLIEI